jgi:hypothetical protein
MSIDNWKGAVQVFKKREHIINPHFDTTKVYEGFYKPKGIVPLTEFDLHIPGAKADNGKPDLDLVFGDFTRALTKVGEIGTAGAKKYSRSGWLQVPNALSRYSSAMWRHIFQFKEGQDYDAESGQLHLAHAAWNALAVLELYLRQQESGTRKTTNSNS